MNSDVMSATPDMPLLEIVDLLLENRIGAVPVIDEDQGELMGVVSYVDVLRAVARGVKD